MLKILEWFGSVPRKAIDHSSFEHNCRANGWVVTSVTVKNCNFGDFLRWKFILSQSCLVFFFFCLQNLSFFVSEKKKFNYDEISFYIVGQIMVRISIMCSKDSLSSKIQNVPQDFICFFGESIHFEALIIKSQIFSRKMYINWKWGNSLFLF